jgi:hypothetical protein
MTIKSRVVYETAGKRFDTFDKAVEHREGMVEELLRKLPGFSDIHPYKKRIEFVQAVLDRRDTIRELLDFDSKRPANESDCDCDDE